VLKRLKLIKSLQSVSSRSPFQIIYDASRGSVLILADSSGILKAVCAFSERDVPVSVLQSSPTPVNALLNQSLTNGSAPITVNGKILRPNLYKLLLPPE
jgi:hypothetical protein